MLFSLIFHLSSGNFKAFLPHRNPVMMKCSNFPRMYRYGNPGFDPIIFSRFFILFIIINIIL